MPGWASIAPRPASSTSPSATRILHSQPPGFIPGLPSNPVVAGGLPSIGITGFTGFGRQSTNPQWQDPALIDPKVNFTWVKGKHSMKFGYEYERVWMAVNDNNPLYGSFTYGGGYSNAGGSTVSDNYWADFLFGTTNAYSLANYYVAHLTQNMHSLYAQDDWKARPNLTLNIGLRWEYGSPYADLYNRISNLDPASQTVLTTTPGAVAGNGITPFSGGGTYGKTLVNPDFTDFGPRVGFAYSVDPKTAIRGGFGISYAHYTRAGSGDILGINAPQAQFASVTQIAPNDQQPLLHPASCSDHRQSAPRHRRVLPLRIRATRAASSPASTPRPTTLPTSPKTPRTAMSRATSSASSALWPRTPCSTSLTSAITASSCRAF